MMTIFDEIQCYRCGVVFGVPSGYEEKRREDRESFWCPNGHPQAFVDSATNILRRERDLLKQQLAEKDDEITRQRDLRRQAEKSVSAQKAQVTKLKNRARAGVCPCCTRHFTNLERHMATKHADFAETVQ